MNHLFQTIFLMAPPKEGQNPFMSLLPILLIIVVFYFFMIRPQMKKAKQAKEFRESLKKGDKIITIGAIHGKITDVADTSLVIEVEGGNRLRIEKSAVAHSAQDQLGSKAN